MNDRFSLCLSASVLAIAAFSFTSQALAQSKTETVLDRARPELDAKGGRVGSFTLFPSLTVDAFHDSNIFRTETDEVDDIITVTNPSVRLDSNWNNHRLSINGGAKIGRYVEEGAEDYEDYNFGVDGQIDITRRSNISAGVSFDKLHDDRGSPDETNGINPTESTLIKANTAFSQEFNRLKMKVGGNFSQYDYDDDATATGTTNNDDRDRDETEAFIRLGYEITPQYEAFLRTSYNIKEYDSRTDDNGLQRDSTGYEVRGGVRLDLGGVTFGDVFLGYLTQDYDDPTFSKTQGVTYGAALTWNASKLTTAKLDLSNTIGETTTSGASGTRDTRIAANVDHELRRNILIGANVSFSNSDFRGTTREDDTTAAGIYAKYMLSRYIHLRGSYDYESKDSTSANSDYDDNKFMLRLVGQL